MAGRWAGLHIAIAKPAQADSRWSLNQMSVKGGMFEFYYVRRNLGDKTLPVWSRVSFTTNIPMIQGKWQMVTLSYDQSEIKLTANGKTQAFPLQGVGLYLQLSGFGGRGDRTAAGVIPFFKGNLRAFDVQHHVNATSPSQQVSSTQP